MPGKFSDEKPYAVIKEVIALKPKMYSILCQDLSECKEKRLDNLHSCTEKCHIKHSATAKGVSKISKQKITHQEYDTLLTSGTTMTSAKTIKTFNNSLYSVKITKRGLSAFDDKKYILDNKF